jgi:putative hydrolase of the HAD superfamily
MDQIRFSQAKYFFFFDLDDTLHSFRSASAAATTSTFCLIISHHTGLDLDDLRKIYSQILISSTKYAFTDGKTSHEYRAERYRLLLEHSGLRAGAMQMQELFGLRMLLLRL